MVIEDPAFQPRANGVDPKHVKSLAAAESAGDVLPPVNVARIGDALYLVDGFHRMAVWRAGGDIAVEALVARMSRRAAVEYSLQANTKHGLNLRGKDKAAILQRYCSEGLHLREDGGRKALDTIHQEIGWSMIEAMSVRRCAAGASGTLSLTMSRRGRPTGEAMMTPTMMTWTALGAAMRT
jgi:hypothetical protein